MKVTGNELFIANDTVTVPLQVVNVTSDQFHWDTTPRTSINPGTPAGNWKMVILWCQGIEITARVQAEDTDDNNNFPGLNGPASNYQMGMIQIVSSAIMENKFEHGYTNKWEQAFTPVFDSHDENIGNTSPWYNNGAVRQLGNGWTEGLRVNNDAFFRDSPTVLEDLQLQNPAGNHRLLEMYKKLTFNVFLAVGPRNVQYNPGTTTIRILKTTNWSTETHLFFTWQQPDALGITRFTYRAEKFVRSFGFVNNNRTTSSQSSQALVGGFPSDIRTANSTIIAS